MFNDLYHYFLAKKQQFNRDYENATPEEVRKAIKEVLASQNAETLNDTSYDETKQREHQIVRLLLIDLHCRKMPPVESKVDLEKWEGLESDYTSMEKRLISMQVYSIDKQDREYEDYFQVVEDEVKNLDAYIQTTGLEGDIEPFIAQAPARGEMGDFLRLMAEIKKSHLSAALVHSNYRVGYLTRACTILTEQFETKNSELIDLRRAQDELKTQRQNLEKSNTWVYRWGFQAAHQQANRFQRLVLWAFNFFTSEPIQDSACKLQGDIQKVYVDTTENSKKIAVVSRDVSGLNQLYRDKRQELDHAKKRQAEIVKTITSGSEAGAMLEETITPELPDETFGSFRI